jgi:hypothetical protein
MSYAFIYLVSGVELCHNSDNSGKTLQYKAIPVAGLDGLRGCAMLRISHCSDNRPTDGGKVVSPTHRTHLTPQKHYVSVSFLLESE